MAFDDTNNIDGFGQHTANDQNNTMTEVKNLIETSGIGHEDDTTKTPYDRQFNIPAEDEGDNDFDTKYQVSQAVARYAAGGSELWYADSEDDQYTNLYLYGVRRNRRNLNAPASEFEMPNMVYEGMRISFFAKHDFAPSSEVRSDASHLVLTLSVISLPDGVTRYAENTNRKDYEKVVDIYSNVYDNYENYILTVYDRVPDFTITDQNRATKKFSERFFPISNYDILAGDLVELVVCRDRRPKQDRDGALEYFAVLLSKNRVPTGTIVPFAIANDADLLPGFLRCDGSVIDKNLYPRLHDAMGGGDQERTTPDYRNHPNLIDNGSDAVNENLDYNIPFRVRDHRIYLSHTSFSGTITGVVQVSATYSNRPIDDKSWLSNTTFIDWQKRLRYTINTLSINYTYPNHNLSFSHEYPPVASYENSDRTTLNNDPTKEFRMSSTSVTYCIAV